MTIELTPEMEAIVTSQLSSGRYTSADAVIEDALQIIQKQRPSEADQQSERQARARRMEDLFARIDAEGGFDFEIERHTEPPDEREPW